MKKIISVFLTLVFVTAALVGCGNNAGNETTGEGQNAISSDAPNEVDFSKTDEDMFTDRDNRFDYDENSAFFIELNGTTATSTSDSVTVLGSDITITEEGTYVISGDLTDGTLTVNAPDTAKLQLVLKGVNITSKESAALYILQADKVFLTLAEGSQNTLENTGSFDENDDNKIDATLFSKQDLTLNGTGELIVTSPAGHGIVCKDDLVITGGNYEVNSASHGLSANKSVRIADGYLTIDAGKDAIHSENTDDVSLGYIYIAGGTIKAEAEGDGISAGAYMQITGGIIDLLSGGGAENGTKASSDSFGGFMGGGPGMGRPGDKWSGTQEDTGTADDNSTSMKGLKAGNSLQISGGDITVNSADDSVHSNVSVIINGGTLTIATGDDGIHADETLTVTAGKIDISKSYEGLEALKIDVKGGDIKLVADDDGLNAAGGTDQSGIEGGRDGMFGGGMGGRPGGMSSSSDGSIKISGGTLYIKASGDGIDSNGSLEITGGHTTVVGPTQGDTAILDYDTTAVITGGTFIGTGAAGMTQSFSDSKQGVVAMNIGRGSAGTKILLKDSSGNITFEHTPELDFAVVIISSPDIKDDETYTISLEN